MPRFGWPHLSKPGRGAQIDWTHPLALGLMGFYMLNEGGGKGVYDATGNLNLGIVNGATWGAGPGGRALSCTSNASSAIALLPSRLQFNMPISAAVGMHHIGTPTAFETFFGALTNNTASNPFLAWSIGSGTGGTGPKFGWGTNGYSPSVSLPIGSDAVWSGTWTASSVLGYQSGQPLGSTSNASGSLTYQSTATLSIGDETGTATRTSNALFYWAAWWNRVLSPAEHAQVAANPWQLIVPGPLRSWVFFQGASVFVGSSSGGVVTGGSAAPSVIYQPVASGGVVAGGSATPSLVFTATVGGGPVAGGSASPSAIFAGASGGGMVAGGSAQGTKPGVFVGQSSGGAVLGGLVVPSASFTASAAGGPVVGGSASGFIPNSFVSYVDPTATTLIVSGATSDVDPTQVTVIDTPAADSEIDPTQVTIIQ